MTLKIKCRVLIRTKLNTYHVCLMDYFILSRRYRRGEQRYRLSPGKCKFNYGFS